MKILLSISLCILSVQAWWTEFEMTGVENSDGGILRTDFKVTRANRTTYTISGDIEFTENMESNYDCEARIYGSRQGNNQYTLLPYKIKRDNCCQFFDSLYFRLIEKEAIGYSNLPKRESGVLLCNTWTKGVYTLKPDPVDKNMIVKHAHPGTYKVEMIFYNKISSEISSVVGFIAKLY